MQLFSKKKVYLVLVFGLIILLSTGCSQTEQQDMKSNVLKTVNAEEAKIIKEMTMNSGVKLGDLFEAGISSPTYEFYDPAEDGNTYVTIRGNINYRGKDVVVTIQYKRVSEDEEGSEYEFSAMDYNDIPQNQLEIANFFEYLNNTYEEEQATKVATNDTEKNNSNTTKVNTGSNKNINYSNSRFGYSIDYPAEWGEVEESTNGDGCILFMDDAIDIRVYASYMMEDSFENYIDSYYEGWEYSQTKVSGAKQAAKLIYYGEESYQSVLIAEKDGTVYTFMIVDMYIDAEYSDEMREAILKEAEMAEKSFKIY